MKKKITLLTTIFITSALSKVEVKFKEENNISIKDKEVKIILKMINRKGIKTSPQMVKKYIEENRILSKKYFNTTKKSKINEFLIFKALEIEEELAKNYLNELVKDMKVENEILYSYYISHSSEFTIPKELTLEVAKEKEFEKAYRRYKENNFSRVEKIKVKLNQIEPSIRDIFKDTKVGDKIPPLFFKGSFLTFKVKDIIPQRREKFENVKENIKKKILNLKLKEIKNNIIKDKPLKVLQKEESLREREEENLRTKFILYWKKKAEGKLEDTYKMELPYQRFLRSFSWYKDFNSIGKKGSKVKIIRIKYEDNNISATIFARKITPEGNSFEFKEKWFKVYNQWFHKMKTTYLPIDQ